MDNYSLEDVKKLVEKKLITSDVLKNILESTTRRLELYNDPDDLAILKYLSSCKSVPKTTKSDINKYLSEYDKITVENKLEEKDTIEARKNNIIWFISIIVILIIICVILLIKRG